MSADLVLFSEQEAQHFDRITGEVAIVRRQLEALVIADQATATRCHNGLAEAKKVLLDVDRIRKAQVTPLNDQVRAINAAWKPLTDALEKLETAAKRKLVAWQQAERERVAREQAEARRRQEEAQREEQEAMDRAAEARNSKAREKALADANAATTRLMEARVAEPMPAPTGIKTDFGTTSTRMRWTFQVLDAAQVPREFLCVDEKKLRAAVAQGARAIPGVQIWEEEQLSTRVVGA